MIVMPILIHMGIVGGPGDRDADIDTNVVMLILMWSQLTARRGVSMGSGREMCTWIWFDATKNCHPQQTIKSALRACVYAQSTNPATDSKARTTATTCATISCNMQSHCTNEKCARMTSCMPSCFITCLRALPLSSRLFTTCPHPHASLSLSSLPSHPRWPSSNWTALRIHSVGPRTDTYRTTYPAPRHDSYWGGD